MSLDTLAVIIAITAPLASGLVWFFAKGVPALRKWGRFIDRIGGVPADPRKGQPEVPGIFERLDRQDAVLETIRHEVEFNNGTSVKDAVTRIERSLADHLAATPAQTVVNVHPEAQQ